MLLDIEKLLPVIAMLWGWGLTSLIVNLGVSGAWILQGKALRVTDTDTEFYANCSVSAVLATAEEEKKYWLWLLIYIYVYIYRLIISEVICNTVSLLSLLLNNFSCIWYLNAKASLYLLHVALKFLNISLNILKCYWNFHAVLINQWERK